MGMIDREKVIRHIIAEICIAKTCKKDFASVDIDMLSDALAMLKEQPEIIRCKDCKHGAPTIINGVWLSVTCDDVDHRPDWFCADGERWDDG